MIFLCDLSKCSWQLLSVSAKGITCFKYLKPLEEHICWSSEKSTWYVSRWSGFELFNTEALEHREFSIYGSWDGQKGIYLLYICEMVGGVTFTVIHSSGASNHNPVCTELINVILKLCSKEQFKNFKSNLWIQ